MRWTGRKRLCIGYLRGKGLRFVAAEELYKMFSAEPDVIVETEEHAVKHYESLAKTYRDYKTAEVVAELKNFLAPNASAFLALAGMCRIHRQEKPQ
jgi:hypothetical protein